MEDTQHFSQFLNLLVSFFNIAPEKERNGMNTLRTYLFRAGLPPQQQEIQEIRADIILIHPIMIDHPTQTLNRENPDISILLKNEMRDSLHKSVRVVER